MSSSFDIRIGAKSLACGHDRPADPCQLVGQSHGYQPLRLPGPQRVDPVGESAFALACDTQHRSRARDKHFADIAVALFGDSAELLFATARILPGRRPSHAAKSRPDLNTPGSGTLAAVADAISVPMPEISSSKRLVGFCLCALAISSSTVSIDRSSPSRCPAMQAAA